MWRVERGKVRKTKESRLNVGRGIILSCDTVNKWLPLLPLTSHIVSVSLCVLWCLFFLVKEKKGKKEKKKKRKRKEKAKDCLSFGWLPWKPSLAFPCLYPLYLSIEISSPFSSFSSHLFIPSMKKRGENVSSYHLFQEASHKTQAQQMKGDSSEARGGRERRERIRAKTKCVCIFPAVIFFFSKDSLELPSSISLRFSFFPGSSLWLPSCDIKRDAAEMRQKQSKYE